jgi:hypothetical protein
MPDGVANGKDPDQRLKEPEYRRNAAPAADGEDHTHRIERYVDDAQTENE